VLSGEGLRRACVRVPPNYPGTPTPLIIALHGAGGQGDAFGAPVDALGAIVLALDSLHPSWDAIEDAFGADVGFINDVLDHCRSVKVRPDSHLDGEALGWLTRSRLCRR
jgi:poly(3-hydroxybutyrate) depolymerase